MHKRILSLSLFSLLTLGAAAQVQLVNPTPQSVSTQGALFAAPKAWRVSTTKALTSSYAYAALAEMGVQQSAKATFRLTLGVAGDKTVSKYARLIPTQAEGYYLAVGPKGAVVAGRDERGLYYGLQTLRGMMGKGQLETCTISDWPDVPFRGAIEGFYGRPWSHEHRLRQLDFYGANKMNVYIYGPKDDPYHRDKWREPYPEKEMQQILELNERAKKRGVNFYWAIHPGVDIKWNEEDRHNLVNKLEKMYALGIRSFAVFFDDIWGEGAKGENQAALLNYVDSVFVKKHGDVAPLVLCPTEYNRAWSRDDSKYLKALGEGLNKGIEVMWTGNSVVHTISKEGMEWINQRIKRKGYIWFNFPVNDFVRDHLLLGPTYGNDLNIAGDLSGFVSNPMQYAESSKIALYSIADYTWNMKAYQWEQSWDKALRDLLPSDSAALKTFASYNEDLGPNGHRFRRDESRHLKGIEESIKRVLAGKAVRDGEAAEAFGLLRGECQMLGTACDLLLVNKENPWLIDELRPWLVQGKLVAQYGQLVCDMDTQFDKEVYENPLGSFEARYAQARALRKQMYENEIDKRQLHFYQTGTKLATLRLMPLLDLVLNKAIERYNKERGTQLQPIAAYTPFAIESNVPQLANQPLTLSDYGKTVNVTPSNEVIKWPAGSQFTIKAEKPFAFQGMDFNFGVPGIAAKFRLEVQSEDGTWREVGLLHKKEDTPVINTTDALVAGKAKAFRITNITGEEVQCYFRAFKWKMQ
ncbi:MAG: beta-N-acetylglucosaminidase domain-containing protein [Bacteroidales bacterium]|nr:beta-N-acetylglucosaminidase domain-containing protein [Bacteroidales bacterium]